MAPARRGQQPPACIQKGPDVADEHLVVLKQGAVPELG